MRTPILVPYNHHSASLQLQWNCPALQQGELQACMVSASQPASQPTSQPANQPASQPATALELSHPTARATEDLVQLASQLLTSSEAFRCGDDTAMMTLASHTSTVPVLWAMATCVTSHLLRSCSQSSCKR
jgi:hypothetical protein